MCEYWERFKKLCACCPHHQISEQLLLRYFYEGLSNKDRSTIDAASGGALGDMTPIEARNLIEKMAPTPNNSVQEMMLLSLEESMRGPQIHLHLLKIKSLRENLMPWPT